MAIIDLDLETARLLELHNQALDYQASWMQKKNIVSLKNRLKRYKY